MTRAAVLGLITFLLVESHLPFPAYGNPIEDATAGVEGNTEVFNQTSASSIRTASSTTTPTPTTGSSTAVLAVLSTTASTTLPPVSRISPVRNYNWVVALIVLASAGILTVIGLELYIQFKICGGPLTTDCSSQWMGHVLLFGVFLSYLLMYAFIPYPCPTTCGIIRFCVGVCYALCFGVIVVKLVVILSPVEMHAGVSLVLFFFVWTAQIVIDVQWLIQDHPDVTRIDNIDGYVCDPGFDEHVKSLVYVMALIVCSLCACAVARRGKSDVTNADDIVYIGLSCGFTVSVWIVWILLGYLKDDTEYHDPCLAFGLLATATVLLVFIFVPKIRQLNRIEEFTLETKDNDVTKQEIQFKTEAGSIVSASKRSHGSSDGVSWNGGHGGSTSGNGNRREGNSRTMDTLVEDEEFDPFALHLQYPARDEQHPGRWGSVHSAEGYDPRIKRTPSASSRTSEPNRRSTVNHVNRNNSHAHSEVNHNPKPEYSYVVSSSLRRTNQMNQSVVNNNHNPRPKQSRH